MLLIHKRRWLGFKTYSTLSGTEIQISVAPPHQFALDYQRQLLPNWNVPISHLILILQQASLSLKETTTEVSQEKNHLRSSFIRFGCDLIFALQDRQYQSDLFDPRTGYPLLDSPDLSWDDNAAVQAVLGFPVLNYNHCSLLTHPVWNHQVYPSTVATSAPQNIIECCLEQLIKRYRWQLMD